MVRVLFVCLGNICRSPTAEGVMRAQLAEAGLDDRVEVDSAGTGSWHVGHPPDERSVATAAERGIVIEGAARRVVPEDLDTFHFVVAMDRENLADLKAMAASDEHHEKLVLLRELDHEARQLGELDVPDPYYGGDAGFTHVLDVVEAGCQGLLERVREHL